jgi:hypothetical protein
LLPKKQKQKLPIGFRTATPAVRSSIQTQRLTSLHIRSKITPFPPSQVLLKRTEAQNMPTSAMSIPALQFTACTRNALTPYQTQPCDTKKTVSRVSQKPASHKVSLRRHTRLRRTGCMSDGSARSHHTTLSTHQSYGGIVCMTRHTPFFSATCQIAYQGAEPATGAKGRCQGLLY